MVVRRNLWCANKGLSALSSITIVTVTLHSVLSNNAYHFDLTIQLPWMFNMLACL